LSYASEDLNFVQRIYNELAKRGLDLWFDKADLKPGSWYEQVMKAIPRSSYFVICISESALTKLGDDPGFQDNELNRAFEIAMRQLSKDFSIIPVRIERCDRGDSRLTIFQQYDLFENFENNINRLAVDMGGISLA